MHDNSHRAVSDPRPLFDQLQTDLASIISGERNFIANLANCSALIYHSLPQLNWTGFYLANDNELVLGPFQGRPACVRIAYGKGVCGAAFEKKQTVIVPDVHQFPGHIACDSASKSEIVVPLLVRGRPIGVLDLDSPIHDRFQTPDALGLESIVKLLLDGSDLPDWSC